MVWDHTVAPGCLPQPTEALTQSHPTPFRKGDRHTDKAAKGGNLWGVGEALVGGLSGRWWRLLCRWQAGRRSRVWLRPGAERARLCAEELGAYFP